MNRPIHFEFQANDPDRAQRFYETVFGWKFQKWDGPEAYRLITTGEEGTPGINGGMMKGDDMPNSFNTVGVENLDKQIEIVKQAGGEIVSPKQAIPGVGWHCYARDTEGNMFGMIEENPQAK